MNSDATAPDSVTMTIYAADLIAGHVIIVPMTESLETVTKVATSSGYVSVHTTGTGPGSAYHWPAEDEINVLQGGVS